LWITHGWGFKFQGFDYEVGDARRKTTTETLHVVQNDGVGVEAELGGPGSKRLRD
jgi:hypothetical protein